jgi:hypothetical protein
MLTEEKIVCGTLDELREYFSFVDGNKFEWVKDFPLERQLDPERTDSPYRIVFYMRNKHPREIDRVWVFIRS